MTRLNRRMQLKESTSRNWPDNYHNVYTFEENFNDNEGNDDLLAPLGTGNFTWSAGTGQVDDELKLDAIATVASKVNHSFWLADEEGDLPFSIVASIKKRGHGMSGLNLSNFSTSSLNGDYEFGGSGVYCYKSTGGGYTYLNTNNDYNWYYKVSDYTHGGNTYYDYIIYFENQSSPNETSYWCATTSILTPVEVASGVGTLRSSSSNPGTVTSALGDPDHEERGAYSPYPVDESWAKITYDFADLDREIIGFYESGNGDCLAKLAINPSGRIYFNRYGKDSQSNYRYLTSCNSPLANLFSTGTAYTKNYQDDYDDGDWINIMVTCSGIIDEVVEDKMYIDGVEIATGSRYAESSGGGIINEIGSSYKGMEDFSNGVVMKIGSGCRDMSYDELVLINEELDSSDATDINTDFTNGTGSGG